MVHLARASLVLAATLPVACGGWSNADTLAEMTFAAATTVDGAESWKVGRDCIESNPFVGSCGQRLNWVLPSAIAMHYLTALVLPAGSWRRGWQLLGAGVEINQAWQNYQLGYRP